MAEPSVTDNKERLKQQLQNANFFRSTKQSKTTSKSKTNSLNPQNEEKSKDKHPSKPGQARKLRLYLVDPERFVIEWCTPKKMGNPLPIYYDIVINGSTFKKVVTQNVHFPDSFNKKNENHKKRPHTFRILVVNCEADDVYKVGIDSYNDEVKGRQTTLYRIETITKPSNIRDLQINNGVISWKEPIYSSFGDLKYELLNAQENETKSIATINDTDECKININEYYKNNKDDLHNLKWKIRVTETKHGNYSVSPVFAYNDGMINCATFTAATIYDGNINTFDPETQFIKYPKWTPAPEPDVLKDIENIQLVDKGSYLLVPTELDADKNENVLRVICFSDTHTKHKHFRFDDLPSADIVIHAGDFSFDGNEDEVLEFDKWGKFLSSLNINEEKNQEIYEDYYNNSDEHKIEDIAIKDRKYKHLICIAGNHETTFDVEWYNKKGSDAKRYHRLIQPPLNAQQVKDIIINSQYWMYLEDSEITLYGLKIYGSPFQPYFYNWAFQKSRGKELMEKWQNIPNDTNILITHGPPYCHGDKVALERVKNTGDNRQYFGDQMLMKRIVEIGCIQYHVFGHIHAGTGASTQKGVNTTFINAASLNESYHPRDKPLVFYVEKQS